MSVQGTEDAILEFWTIMKLTFGVLMSWFFKMKNIWQEAEDLWRRRENTFTSDPLTKLGTMEYFKKHTQQVVLGSLHASGMPEVLCVFTAIMWFMVFIGEVLAQFGMNWSTTKEQMSKIRLPDFMRQILSQVTRQIGNWKNIREKIGDEKTQVVRKPHQKEKSAGPKTLMLLGLVEALALMRSIPVMKSRSDKKILQKVKKQRIRGVLAINKLSDQELVDIRNIAQIIPTELVKPAQVKTFIIGTGVFINVYRRQDRL